LHNIVTSYSTEVTKHNDEPDEDGDDVGGGIYNILYTDGGGEDWGEGQ
jgi:hypothetical protein